MSFNNKNKDLNDLAKITVSESEKDEILNSLNSEQINNELHNFSNIKFNSNKKPKAKKNYLDDNLNFENLKKPKKGINYELIRKYEKEVEELNENNDKINDELKKVKREKYEKEQELNDAIYEKEKLERKHESEIKRLQENNNYLEDKNNKLSSENEILKRKSNENSKKIDEYDNTIDKCKKLERENRKLREDNNTLKEQFNEGKNRKIEAEKNYEEMKLENMILKQNNENLKKNLIESETKIKNQEEKISELENDLRDMNKRNQNYIEKLTDKNLSLDNTYKDKITKELNEMRNRYESDIFMLKKQYDDLSEKKTSYLKEERDEYRSKYNQCESMLKEKDESLNITQNQLRDLITKTNAEISHLKLQLNIKTEELNSKSAIYEEQISSLNFFKNDNEALKEKNDLLRREMIKLDADNKTKIAQYSIELTSLKEKIKLYEDAENKLDNLINLAPGENDDNELVEIIKDTPSSNKRRINQNLTLATKVKMLSEENEKLRLVIDKMNNDLQEMTDQCKIYKGVIDNVKQPNSYLITNLKDRETEIYKLKQEILDKEQENNRLREENKTHIETINKIKTDMQKVMDNRKKIDDLQSMLTNFIQKEKAGKNNYNDINNMNNYVNSFNNNLSGTGLSLNNFSTQQKFYNTASSGFRQQKPERDIEAMSSNKKVSPPRYYKNLKKNEKKH
mgnify:CR=1 FL=1